jgi:hypothetical protein
MLAHTRRWVLLPLIALLVSACGAGSAGTSASPALSGQGGASNAASVGSDDAVSAQTAIAALDSAPVVSVGRALIRPIRIAPNVKAKPWLINFVSAGVAQSGVPCISCVSGAQTQDNIGLTGPSSYVPSGSEWQYSLSFTDISFTGKCKLSWAITAGKKVVDKFAATLNLPSAGGFVLYALNRARPAYSGAALLTGTVSCGTTGTQKTQAPLYFQ